MTDPTILSLVINLVIALVSAAFAAGGAFLAVRVKLIYMERDIKENKGDIKSWRSEFKDDLKTVHSRISHLNDRVAEVKKQG